MSRVAIFQPIVTLDLDTKEMKVDFSACLTGIEYSADHFGPGPRDDEVAAGVMMDKILDDNCFIKASSSEQAAALRNLAAHIDQYTIQEQELG